VTAIRNTKQLFEALCTLPWRGSLVAVEIAKTKPQVTLRSEDPEHGSKVSREVHPLPMESADWARWGRKFTAEWWAVSFSGIPVSVGSEKIPGHLLAYGPYQVWESRGVRVFHHSGPSRIYWLTDHGLQAWEPVSTTLGGSFAVVSDAPLSDFDKVWVREMITVTRPGDWRLPADTQDSTSLYGKLAITDCLPDGVARDLVDETAAWLSRTLPLYKVGTPSIEDVRVKLSLENRLRIEEKVVGSSRPLAFTLQAIEDTTFPWPGLWLISESLEDIRNDLPVLLAWDATLAAVAAVARLHVDVKPGLWYGPGISQTILYNERRFSKRDAGTSEAAYLQVNPFRMVGPAAVVAARLLQAATHELSHVGLDQFYRHSEIYAQRREQLFLNAAELLPAISRLVTALRLDHRPLRPSPLSPITLSDWLHESLLNCPTVSVERLARSWAAVRNLTNGRALRDVTEALDNLALAGQIRWSPDRRFASTPDVDPTP
jgi:hypothetical protein